MSSNGFYPIRTQSGRIIDIRSPGVSDIDLHDIAHSLSMLCRWNGHVDLFYSVAEHCVNVVEDLDRANAPVSILRQALLHDAAEAYLGDLIGPVKKAIRGEHRESEFDRLETIWLITIGSRFKVALTPMHDAVRRADERALERERGVLTSLQMARVHGLGLSIQEAREGFLHTARRLGIA